VGQYTDPETGLQYLRARYYDNDLRKRSGDDKRVLISLDEPGRTWIITFEVDRACFSGADEGRGDGWLVGDVAANGAMCLLTDGGEVADPVFNPQIWPWSLGDLAS
jgi:hypothetical protein